MAYDKLIEEEIPPSPRENEKKEEKEEKKEKEKLILEEIEAPAKKEVSSKKDPDLDIILDAIHKELATKTPQYIFTALADLKNAKSNNKSATGEKEKKILQEIFTEKLNKNTLQAILKEFIAYSKDTWNELSAIFFANFRQPRQWYYAKSILEKIYQDMLELGNRNPGGKAKTVQNLPSAAREICELHDQAYLGNVTWKRTLLKVEKILIKNYGAVEENKSTSAECLLEQKVQKVQKAYNKAFDDIRTDYYYKCFDIHEEQQEIALSSENDKNINDIFTDFLKTIEAMSASKKYDFEKENRIYHINLLRYEEAEKARKFLSHAFNKLVDNLPGKITTPIKDNYNECFQFEKSWREGVTEIHQKLICLYELSVYNNNEDDRSALLACLKVCEDFYLNAFEIDFRKDELVKITKDSRWVNNNFVDLDSKDLDELSDIVNIFNKDAPSEERTTVIYWLSWHLYQESQKIPYHSRNGSNLYKKLMHQISILNRWSTVGKTDREIRSSVEVFMRENKNFYRRESNAFLSNNMFDANNLKLAQEAFTEILAKIPVSNNRSCFSFYGICDKSEKCKDQIKYLQRQAERGEISWQKAIADVQNILLDASKGFFGNVDKEGPYSKAVTTLHIAYHDKIVDYNDDRGNCHMSKAIEKIQTVLACSHWGKKNEIESAANFDEGKSVTNIKDRLNAIDLNIYFESRKVVSWELYQIAKEFIPYGQRNGSRLYKEIMYQIAKLNHLDIEDKTKDDVRAEVEKFMENNKVYFKSADPTTLKKPKVIDKVAHQKKFIPRQLLRKKLK